MAWHEWHFVLHVSYQQHTICVFFNISLFACIIDSDFDKDLGFKDKDKDLSIEAKAIFVDGIIHK